MCSARACASRRRRPSAAKRCTANFPRPPCLPPNLLQADLEQQLIDAVTAGDARKVSSLLKAPGGRSAAFRLNGREEALLPAAAGLGQAEVVECLLAAGEWRVALVIGG